MRVSISLIPDKNAKGGNMEKKKRSLSAAEQKRLDRYEQLSEEMRRQGYTRKELTIGMGKANLFAFLLLIPLAIIGYGLYYVVNQRLEFETGFNLPLLLISIIVLLVLHELIHGFSWSRFTPHGFKDIEFGIMRSSLTPYCTCLAPLKKNQHIIGTIMPMIVLGIIPMILGIILGNPGLLFIGIVMSDAAAGDLMVIHRILSYKSNAKDIVYMDHPTEAGGVIFER